MALKTPLSAVSVSRQALRHYRSRNVSSVTRPLASTCPRTFTTSASRPSEAYAEEPRWNHTPPRMKAPFSPHITVFPERSKWEVNEDPEKLDNALNTFLGRDNAKILPEELKWLAVTHKSFDQGRRGFNDRLAFLGNVAWYSSARRRGANLSPRSTNLHLGGYGIHSHLDPRPQSHGCRPIC